MGLPFKNDAQATLYGSVTSQLVRLGYRGDLLQEMYSFPDWFVAGARTSVRTVDAAAFGRKPFTYENACIAVVLANGVAGAPLIGRCRALGAPIALEVGDKVVSQWRVGRSPSPSDEIARVKESEINGFFASHGQEWAPQRMLRTKRDITLRPRQLDFFDAGLIPALEEHIKQKLNDLLQEVVLKAEAVHRRSSRRKANAEELVRLVFRFLAGKVLFDREAPGFKSLALDSVGDEILRRVEKHYSDHRQAISDPDTRDYIHSRLWGGIDLRNMSVEVLAYLYENTLVAESDRRELGIHATHPSIARYMVRRLIDKRPRRGTLVVEPCCGQSTFLIAALRHVMGLLPKSLSRPDARHRYFKDVLVGFEADPFALEVGRLSLTLADYPNPNGWRLKLADVFAPRRQSRSFVAALRKAAVVLCNPPFTDFRRGGRAEHVQFSVHRPAEILMRVLRDLNPKAGLGFVMPQKLLDGRGYTDARKALCDRFDEIEIVSLPDTAFETADAETVLVIGRGPRHRSGKVRLHHGRVSSRAWEPFRDHHQIDTVMDEERDVASATESLTISVLRDVWEYLREHRKLGQVAELHRGIEWNIPLTQRGQRIPENVARLISATAKRGFAEGVENARNLVVFERPPTCYLNCSSDLQRGNALGYSWDCPKVLLNANRMRRGPWAIAAFADDTGLVVPQTLYGVWPDEFYSTTGLAAILNGPIACAFVSDGADKFSITKKMLKGVPLPDLSREEQGRIEDLVEEYLAAVRSNAGQQAGLLLKRIDAAVLKGYDLPPELERVILEYFRGSERPVPSRVEFGEYFPADSTPWVPLHIYLSRDCRRSTAGELRRRHTGEVPKAVIAALRRASREYEE